MDVKEAISIAKSYIADVFADEGVFNIGLEEVEFNGPKWEVTIGFSRKWDKPPRNPFSSLASVEQPDLRAINRTYKIVEVDDETKEVLGVRNRVGLV
ncbi:hypothetical protein [Novosphingobium sp. KN65.2]|uniref:hypothetical protein n=1 Tax=Novosphingobium sp. KN65.2 TaxID=1478134 RepID=UPI0009E7FE19|nr:hypothetical protein [Novosphingobium sp. KN65.2]